MPRRHPLCFVCLKPLGDGSSSSTMRMTWAGLPGKPEIVANDRVLNAELALAPQ